MASRPNPARTPRTQHLQKFLPNYCQKTCLPQVERMESETDANLADMGPFELAAIIRDPQKPVYLPRWAAWLYASLTNLSAQLGRTERTIH